MKKVMIFAVCMVFVIAGLAQAYSTTGNLEFVSNYNTISYYFDKNSDGTLESYTSGGGSFDVSKLNNVPLPYLYCVDLDQTIGGGSYPATIINNEGIVKGSALPNAAQVAYLLQTYASLATNNDKEAALQAAIWEAIYGVRFQENLSGLAKTEYDKIVLTGTGDVSKFLWITPKLTEGGANYQAQVTVPGSGYWVPIPPSVYLLGAGLLGLYGIRRRFSKTK